MRLVLLKISNVLQMSYTNQTPHASSAAPQQCTSPMVQNHIVIPVARAVGHDSTKTPCPRPPTDAAERRLTLRTFAAVHYNRSHLTSHGGCI